MDLHLALRRAGVIHMPSPWGRLFLSTAHDEGVLAQTRAAFDRAAAQLSSASASAA